MAQESVVGKSLPFIKEMPRDLNQTAKPKADEVKSDKDPVSFGHVLKSASKKDGVRPNEEASPTDAPQKTDVKATGNKKPVDHVSENHHEIKKTVDAHAKAPLKAGDEDEDGLMMKSYDGAVVSYPMSRIAKDSLDDETKESLQAQGLWDLPTYVAAQPSSKLANMGQISQQLDGPKQLPVHKPIAQLMASLENDLGVSPDRLVKAFQKLPPGQLQLPPEQTMVQVVKNLNLEPARQTQALNAYSQMLAQMQMLSEDDKIDLPFQAAPAAPTVGKGLQDAKEVVGKYNALQAPLPNKETDAKAVVPLQDGMDQKVAPMNSAGVDEASAKNLGGKNEGTQTDTLRSSVTDGKNLNSFESGIAIQGQGSSEGGLGAQMGSPQGQEGGQSFGQSANQNQNGLQSYQNQVQNRGVSKESSSIKEEVKSVKSSLVSTPSSVSSAANTNAQTVAPEMKPAAAGQAGGVSLAGAQSSGAAHEMKLSANEKHEAIQAIVNHAQMLAQKGGGEMRVTLKPDHVGEIQLHVAMEGNRVNVQMKTESSEVKKLMEQNVHELRHGLAQHNLSMEKIDVALNQKSVENFSRPQPDFNAAQDFSGQFHQQNSQREFMDELANLRNLAPRNLSAMSSGQNLASKALNAGSRVGSGRLSVVA